MRAYAAFTRNMPMKRMPRPTRGTRRRCFCTSPINSKLRSAVVRSGDCFPDGAELVGGAEDDAFTVFRDDRIHRKHMRKDHVLFDPIQGEIAVCVLKRAFCMDEAAYLFIIRKIDK